MPVGKWATFQECITAQMKKGYNKKVAGAVCAKIEQNMKKGKANLTDEELQTIELEALAMDWASFPYDKDEEEEDKKETQ